MSPNKVVAVIGSTGAQGFSVVQSLLPSFFVRAFTRSQEKLQSLASENPNLSVVQVDPNDTAAVKAALHGVWALFVNTFSDYTQPLGVEEKQGKGIVDAAAEAGVEWLVFSSLPDNMPFRAFVDKANVMKYAREIARKSSMKNVFVELGYYMSNSLWNPPVQAADGVVEFRWSTIDEKTYLPLIATQTDLGPILKAILEDPAKWEDTEIPIVGETLTVPQIAEIYGRVRNVPTRAVFLHHIPLETSFDGWIDMHRDFKEVGYFPAYKGRESEIREIASKLYPGLKSWEAWLREDDTRLDYVKH
ncbi:hypothetical protein EIP91_002897 [Steccherinum ochraceum]|uniref:NmrA-like domain-containing protein n=1 Tax=Steccherinum ochraceum TaxID=92696 RepID=A0A4R0RPD7_9APHY|nr:hypothetical protein EIP91_002897 [Steccherinum ochraceum]